MKKRQDIKGLIVHPEKETLALYDDNAPVGSWLGCLEFHAWGKSQNLFCYFTHLLSDKKYRLCVFAQNDYTPYAGNIYFDKERLGEVFEITISESKNGKAKFMNASPVDRDMDFYTTPEGIAELEASQSEAEKQPVKKDIPIDENALPF